MGKLKERMVRHSRSRGEGSPDVWGIYEPDTGSIQYICADPATKKAALIDVAWNFDPKHYRFSTESMDQVLDLVREQGLTVEWVLDTHPHADHVMASAHLKERTGAPNAIGAKVHDIAHHGTWFDVPDARAPVPRSSWCVCSCCVCSSRLKRMVGSSSITRPIAVPSLSSSPRAFASTAAWSISPKRAGSRAISGEACGARRRSGGARATSGSPSSRSAAAG